MGQIKNIKLHIVTDIKETTRSSITMFRLSHTITPSAMQGLREAFKEFDHNQDGSISKNELSRVMKNFHSLVSDEELEQMIELVDTNGDGSIDFNEFFELMANSVGVENDTDEMKTLFAAIDTDNDGFITEEEITNMLKTLGEKIRKKDV